MTINQLLKTKKKGKLNKVKTPRLKKCPQKKGICRKVFITTPKKPNSAQRKVTKVWFSSTDENTNAYIPGIGHNLQTHASVLVRGGRVKDLPGMRYKVIRGKYDAKPVANRRQGRSCYGVKSLKPKTKKNYKWSKK